MGKKGHEVDWILQAADGRAGGGARPYGSGTAYVAAANDGLSRFARVRRCCADIRNDFRVFGLLASRDYALVQIKDKYIGALIAIAAAKLYRVPVFYWLAYPHGEASLYAARTGVARYPVFYRLRGLVQKWLLYRVIMPACAHVFVQSEQMRADVAREGIPREKMTAVPSSVDIGEIDAACTPRGRSAPRGEQTIVYLGTLLRERRLDFLVLCLLRVLAHVPDAKLVLVGSGESPEDEAWLWREAGRAGVSRAMTITGRLPGPAAWQHVRDAAVCVSPYYPTPILLSTSPTKLVEYMALGKAVVASEHPEQSEVIEHSGGGMVCRWNVAEFADAMVRLLRDPATRTAMGRAGRRYVEQWRAHSVMVERVERRYRDLLYGRPLIEPTSRAARVFDAPRLSRSPCDSKISQSHDA
jgi:glycosyltransferase involved in cell wall biosynthesis